jgi:hypothetical protein
VYVKLKKMAIVLNELAVTHLDKLLVQRYIHS